VIVFDHAGEISGELSGKR